MKNSSIFIFLFFIGKLAFSQDTIVKRNKEIIQAKISEITPTEIKYKKFSFQDGPTYIENKSDVEYIRFSNGLKEEFVKSELPERTTITITPQPPPTKNNTLENNADYYNPNASFSEGPKKMEAYGSRYKYQGRKISEREMQQILMKTQDKQIVSYVQTAKDARSMSFIGFAAFPLGMGSIYFLTQSVTSQGTLNTGNFAAAVLCLGGSIACPILSGVYKHKRGVYNRKAVELYNQRF